MVVATTDPNGGVNLNHMNAHNASATNLQVTTKMQ